MGKIGNLPSFPAYILQLIRVENRDDIWMSAEKQLIVINPTHPDSRENQIAVWRVQNRALGGDLIKFMEKDLPTYTPCLIRLILFLSPTVAIRGVEFHDLSSTYKL